MIVRFHPLAVEQQEGIWYYTAKTWGEEQADKYVRGLHAKLAELPDDLNAVHIKKPPIDCGLDVFMIRYEHHFIFFRKASQSPPPCILVFSILHESMDIPTRLREALRQV